MDFKPKRKSGRKLSLSGMMQPNQAGRIGLVNDFSNKTPSVGNFKQRDGFKTQQAPQALGNLINKDPTRLSFDSPRFEGKNSQLTHKPKKTRRGKLFKRGAMILGILLLMLGGYFGLKAWSVARRVLGGGGGALALQREVDPTKLNGEGDGRINVLLLGKGGEDHPGGQLTDTLLVASIDPLANEAAILSIPRDLWVRPEGYGSMKINAVYNSAREYSLSRGKSKDEARTDGVGVLNTVISESIGIPIHYYVMIDFQGYKEAVDTVGGISINLSEPIYDPNFDWEYGKNALKLPSGQVDLNGTQALLLGRARGAAGGYGVGTDFDRNENQRKMLIALQEKILSAGTYGNPARINQLLNTFSDNIKTNFNGVAELKRLYDIIQNIQPSTIRSLSFVDPPNVLITTSNIEGQSVVIPRQGISDFSEMKKFVRTNLVDGFLRSEAAAVGIFNGTNVNGLATKTAEELRSYGYNVSIVESAKSSDFIQTVLIDRTNGVKKYTRAYLEKRLGVTAQTSLPDPAYEAYSVDFVIIVGTDEASRS